MSAGEYRKTKIVFVIDECASMIREAKDDYKYQIDSRKDNGSPKLVYSPNNDTDDYTQVVAYINEEFARIQKEETEYKGINVQETAQEITSNKPIEDKIIRLLEKNPRMTRKDLSQTLNISTDAVKRKLEKLKKEGRISRQGSTKAGWWIVRESN